MALPIAGVPIPLALGPFAIYTTALVLGGFRAFIAALLYVLLGCLGLPIFAKGASGFGTLATPTGGYLLAYPLGALLAGTLAYTVIRRKLNPWLTAILCIFCAMVGFVVISAGGILGLMTNGHMEFTHAFVIAASFALPDLLKSIVASIVASAVHRAFPGLVRSKARR
nr:biotin transporter BioY [Rothia dentocariosa]